MDFIIERKKASDLAISIVDGRYEEQKMRLLQCGLSRLMYLVEGSLSAQDTLPVASLKTALVSTQVAGFKIQQCRSVEDSISWLARLHSQIVNAIPERVHLVNTSSMAARPSTPQRLSAFVPSTRSWCLGEVT